MDLQDWELLHGSDSELVSSPVSVQNLSELEGIDGESEGAIRSDYFSLDSHGKYERPVDVGEEGSVESDNPSWIDPASETRYGRNHSEELWPDSGSDRSDERKSVDLDAKKESGLGGIEKTDAGFEGGSENLGKFMSDDRKSSGFDATNESCMAQTGEIQLEFERVRENEGERKFGSVLENRLSDDYDYDVRNEVNFVEGDKSQLGLVEIQHESENLGDFWSDSGGVGSMEKQLGKFEEENKEDASSDLKTRDESELSGESDGGNEKKVEMEGGNQNDNENVGAIVEVKSMVSKETKSRVVWWKVPLEFLRYCAFRVSPVWSFSVAAAILGIAILGRRLYKMKRKSRSMQVKVTVDDKVSHFLTLTLPCLIQLFLWYFKCGSVAYELTANFPSYRVIAYLIFLTKLERTNYYC